MDADGGVLVNTDGIQLSSSTFLDERNVSIVQGQPPPNDPNNQFFNPISFAAKINSMKPALVSKIFPTYSSAVG
jgi:hypothetical protein